MRCSSNAASAAHNGIVENEFCPVAVGIVDERPQLNPDEVHAIRWISWRALLEEIGRESDYTEWCIEEAILLTNDPAFRTFHEALRDESV